MRAQNEIADINGGLVVSASAEGIALGLLSLLKNKAIKNQEDLTLKNMSVKILCGMLQ